MHDDDKAWNLKNKLPQRTVAHKQKIIYTNLKKIVSLFALHT